MVPSYSITIRNSENDRLRTFLEDRLYAFNAAATGIDDGELLWASVTDAAGAVIAGVSGHTWGGCCEIVQMWVDESRRGQGLGTALMAAAEQEAMRRGCTQIVLTTHSFQAPGFYERLGFERLAAVPNFPRGHENVLYIKRLPDSGRS